MGVSLNKLRAKTAPVEVDVDGETLKIAYRPSAYTPNFLDNLMNARDSGKPSDALVASTLELIANWDLKEDEKDKEPIEITEEILRGIPISMIRDISEAIAEDISVPKSTKKPSGSFS